MIKAVWKYSIKINPRCVYRFDIPKDAEILCIKLMGGRPYLWVLCDPDLNLEAREFISYGTGQAIGIDSSLEYIDSVILPGDKEIYHFFEVK